MDLFFVYGFYLADGTCFYIGKGTGNRDRRKSTSARNKYFINILEKERRENREVTSLKLYENLTQEDALRIENELIEILKPKANIYPSIGGRMGKGIAIITKRDAKRRLIKARKQALIQKEEIKCKQFEDLKIRRIRELYDNELTDSALMEKVLMHR